MWPLTQGPNISNCHCLCLTKVITILGCFSLEAAEIPKHEDSWYAASLLRARYTPNQERGWLAPKHHPCYLDDGVCWVLLVCLLLSQMSPPLPLQPDLFAPTSFIPEHVLPSLSGFHALLVPILPLACVSSPPLSSPPPFPSPSPSFSFSFPFLCPLPKYFILELIPGLHPHSAFCRVVAIHPMTAITIRELRATHSISSRLLSLLSDSGTMQVHTDILKTL